MADATLGIRPTHTDVQFQRVRTSQIACMMDSSVVTFEKTHTIDLEVLQISESMHVSW